MSNVKISQLTTATPLTGSEVVPIVQSGGTVQVALSELKIYAVTSVAADIQNLQNSQVSINAVAAAQDNRIAAVSAEQAQRVSKAGDTMTGPLTITSVAATAPAVSVTGYLADSKGDVRNLPVLNRTSAYIVSVGDAGRVIAITSGGITLNQNVFQPNAAFSIYNSSGSSQTITQGTSVTMYLAGTATTGNRTLAQRGVATVLCVASNTFVISGPGLT